MSLLRRLMFGLRGNAVLPGDGSLTRIEMFGKRRNRRPQDRAGECWRVHFIIFKPRGLQIVFG